MPGGGRGPNRGGTHLSWSDQSHQTRYRCDCSWKSVVSDEESGKLLKFAKNFQQRCLTFATGHFNFFRKSSDLRQEFNQRVEMNNYANKRFKSTIFPRAPSSFAIPSSRSGGQRTARRSSQIADRNIIWPQFPQIILSVFKLETICIQWQRLNGILIKQTSQLQLLH